MRKLYKPKLLLTLSVWLVVFVGGCVDIGVQTIPDSVAYNSQINIVNLISGPDNATLILDGQSLGVIDFGGQAPSASFMQIPSGNRVLNISYNDANAGIDTAFDARFSAGTEYKIRIFMVGTSAANGLVLNYQRYIWQTKDSEHGRSLFPADTGQVAFFNGSPDATLSGVTIMSADTTEVEFTLAMGDYQPYMDLPAGSYSFDIAYGDSSHSTFDYDVLARSRYTVITYDTEANLKNAVLIDD